ncbi:MAG: beta-N-acetylhexosaminidase [Acidimicrobiales bacterium]
MTRGLVPSPRFVEYLSGTVTWRSPLRVSVDDEWRGVVETFGADLEQSTGWSVTFVGEDDDRDVEILRLPELDEEAFQISVAERTRVESSSPAGVAYALTVLRQLGPVSLWSDTSSDAAEIVLPYAVIQDGPSFAWRGVHLDVSRHFFDVDTVCRLIDLLAAHRLNRLHLHLNDDQGWRVEVPSWPRLSEVASTRRSSPVGHEDDGVDDGVVHGGFYRASDLERIRHHASKRFVQLVPEIDLPGHAQAAIAAYPELGNESRPLEVWTRWGISEHVLNVGPRALAFAEDVVLYVASLFPGSPVHIGGDECPTIEWERSLDAQSVMRDHGFHDARQLQGLFTERMAAALQREGHEVFAWDEVLDAEVPTGTVIVAWRSSSKGVAAATRGLDVVMAPMQFLYFDWLSSLSPDEPVAVAPVPFVTTWEKVYGFSVVPSDLDPALAHHVRGAQAQLWSEYITTRDHLDYMLFPRLAAFSEVVWGTASTLSDFRPRLQVHAERLAAMGVHYRPLGVDE